MCHIRRVRGRVYSGLRNIGEAVRDGGLLHTGLRNTGRAAEVIPGGGPRSHLRLWGVTSRHVSYRRRGRGGVTTKMWELLAWVLRRHHLYLWLDRAL